MTKNFRTLILSGFASLVLAGCASSSGKYPSLAQRDAERAIGQIPAENPGEAPVTSAQTFEQLRGFVEKAQVAHQRFAAEQPSALRLARASRGSSIENSTRARALVAVASLTSLHGQTSLALSDLDQLEFSAATAFEATGDIKAAQILVGQMISEQDAALDSLASAINR